MEMGTLRDLEISQNLVADINANNTRCQAKPSWKFYIRVFTSFPKTSTPIHRRIYGFEDVEKFRVVHHN